MYDATKLILDLGKTCRTCLVHKSAEELNALSENNLGKVLCEIANIQLNLHTSLPSSICTVCLKTLNLALDFRNQVRESEAQLGSLICSSEAETDLKTDSTLGPITVIYKTFSVLESTGFSAECEKSTEECEEGKYGQCEELLVLENTDQSCSQNTINNNGQKVLENVFRDKTEVYAICEDITGNDDCIAYFVSDDEGGDDNSVDIVKTNHANVFNIHKDTIFINGNIGNVIKWANSETSSISLRNNVIETIEGNQKGNPIIKEDLVKEQVLINTIKDTPGHCKKKDEEPSENENDAEKIDSNETVKNKSNFCCNLCTKTFRYEFGYKTHLLKHNIPMVCKLCSATFDDTKTYLAHTKSEHTDFKPFACPNCDKNFAGMPTLKKHYYVYHAANTKPRKFACDVCKKKFSQQNFLMAHKRSHSGTNPYQCDTCNKTFSGAPSLKSHQKIHRGEKKHKCNICEARFIHRFSLRAHLRTHSGEKPFVCNLCNSKFSTSSYLRIHMRTHTAEKPYTCSWCEKNFVSRCALAAHEKRHTGERKFQCDVCGWRSTRLADLQTHIRTHTGEKPYFCDKCDKSYKTASNLAAHKKTHLGLREHVCHICSKAFGDPRTLKGHIRVHTGETPYQCHICGNRFKQSGQLSAHKKTH